MKGNEILKAGKYDYAADCYSLAIKYAPQDDVELRGILYSNRSLAYFRKKQFREAKEDAQQCLEYRPQWSKVC